MRTLGFTLAGLLLLGVAVATLVRPVLASPEVERSRSPYDPTRPVQFDAASMTYSYRGIEVSVRLGEEGEPVLPSPMDLGVCELEPEACQDEPPPRLPSPYDPALPIVLDEVRGVYSYRGVEVAVRHGEDGEPVLPTVRDLGLCDVEPESCAEPAQASPPLPSPQPGVAGTKGSR